MAKLTVSLAGVDYDRTRALFDGTVQIAGCETICCAMSPEEAFHRAFRYQESDITELSLSDSMALVARDAHAYIAIAIPVFPSRLFRHSSIYIRGDRGIGYAASWINDDQPYMFEIGTPPLVSLPYSVQTNDVPAYFRDEGVGARIRGDASVRMICVAR